MILCVARLTRQKNLARLILAFAEAAADFPDAVLVIAGEGPELRHLEKLTHRLGLTDRVLLPGWISGKPLAELYRRAAVVVLPSLREGLGLSLVEGARFGKPLLAANDGGSVDVVGENGFLVNPFSVEEIALRLRLFLSGRVSLPTLGQNSLRLFWERFAPEKIAESFAGLYCRATRRAA